MGQQQYTPSAFAQAQAQAQATPAQAGKRATGPYEGLLKLVKERLQTQFPGTQLANLDDERRQQARELVEVLVRDALPRAASAGQPFTQSVEELTTRLMSEIFGWGPLEPYLKMDTVEEIMINRSGRAHV